MIYYTGDIHGSAAEVIAFCNKMELTEDDIVILLGDVGANYFGNWRDTDIKAELQELPPTFFCIHGNHEMRPSTIPTYLTKEWNGGTVWYEEEYPSLLFAKDGELFTLDGQTHLVLGGAYSVDKYYRLSRGYGWWEDEQPSEEIKAACQRRIEACGHVVDIVLSHTCPYKYIPREAFLPMINQDSVDDSTERWLDSIGDSLTYKRWYCGHWHINKRIDKMHFLFHDFEVAEICDADICPECGGNLRVMVAQGNEIIATCSKCGLDWVWTQAGDSTGKEKRRFFHG